MNKVIEIMLFTSALSCYVCMGIAITKDFPMVGVCLGFMGIALIVGASEVAAKRIEKKDSHE